MFYDIASKTRFRRYFKLYFGSAFIVLNFEKFTIFFNVKSITVT